jgi:hypothetical protein
VIDLSQGHKKIFSSELQGSAMAEPGSFDAQTRLKKHGNEER